jgi:choloylglycine hydrolase
MHLRTLFGLIALPLTGLLVSSSHACTSFCMETADGPFYATNLDLLIPGDGLVMVNPRGLQKSGFRENLQGETDEWVTRYGSVTFNLAGREFAWGGMNEAGFVISTMELMASELPEPDNRMPYDSGALIQHVLDTCGSVPEAVETISGIRLVDDGNSPAHFLMLDASGNSAAIEYIDGETVCFTDDTLPVRAMANMPYERSAKAYALGGARWWWSNPGQSAERVAVVTDRATAFDPNGDSPAENYAFDSLLMAAAPHTRWSIVFDTANLQIWFRSERSPTIKHLSFSAFDFSCEAPLLMLDVNSRLEGRVDRAFAPYDREENLDAFATFCGRWGIEVDWEGAEEIMDHFDQFECAP